MNPNIPFENVVRNVNNLASTVFNVNCAFRYKIMLKVWPFNRVEVIKQVNHMVRLAFRIFCSEH